MIVNKFMLEGTGAAGNIALEGLKNFNEDAYNRTVNTYMKQPKETKNESENKINSIDTNDTDMMKDIIKTSEKWRNEQWAREDKIRRETQAREDNAIQRKIADMRAAGVNPNLAYSMNGAAAGGGITSATGINSSLIQEKMSNLNQQEIAKYQNEYERLLKEYEIEQEKAFNGDENAKDRANEILKGLLSAAAIIGAVMLKGG